MDNKIRVMVVDDSAMIRKVLKTLLETDPGIEVIYAAKDPYDARDALITLKPDVITLDIEMPKMDGVTFLKKYMRVAPTPTIIISSLAEKGKDITVQALEAGALEIITKPTIDITRHFQAMADELIAKVRAIAKSKISPPTDTQPANQVIRPISSDHARLVETTEKIIGIGASTGGVEHLARMLPRFPSTAPGLVICQHMPEGFTQTFAKRLNELSTIRVKEAQDGDRILPGHALVAPGGQCHMKIRRSGGQYIVVLSEGEKVSFNRPSVDVLFDSIAQHAGKNAACALLTGMGKDGAQGLLRCLNAGATTVIESERSCVVFGMPGEANKIGAAQLELDLEEIPGALLAATTGSRQNNGKAQ